MKITTNNSKIILGKNNTISPWAALQIITYNPPGKESHGTVIIGNNNCFNGNFLIIPGADEEMPIVIGNNNLFAGNIACPVYSTTIKEQTKIADFLSLIDQRIEKQRRLVESLKKYKRGVIFKLFSKNNPNNQSISLRELLQEKNDRNSLGLRVCSVAVNKGVVDQIEHLGRCFAASDTSKYRRVSYGDVVYTKSPTGDFPYGIVKQSKIHRDVCVSPLYGVYKTLNYEVGNLIHAYFELHQLANNYIRPLAQKGAKNTIKPNFFHCFR